MIVCSHATIQHQAKLCKLGSLRSEWTVECTQAKKSAEHGKELNMENDSDLLRKLPCTLKATTLLQCIYSKCVRSDPFVRSH